MSPMYLIAAHGKYGSKFCRRRWKGKLSYLSRLCLVYQSENLEFALRPTSQVFNVIL